MAAVIEPQNAPDEDFAAPDAAPSAGNADGDLAELEETQRAEDQERLTEVRQELTEAVAEKTARRTIVRQTTHP